MYKTPEQFRFGGTLVLFLVMLNVAAIESGFTSNPKWYRLMYLSVPLMILSIIALRKRSS